MSQMPKLVDLIQWIATLMLICMNIVVLFHIQPFYNHLDLGVLVVNILFVYTTYKKKEWNWFVLSISMIVLWILAQFIRH